MMHLTAVSRRDDAWPAGHPFTVPVIHSLESLEFTAPVTFLVGENGSGKSTLLEAIAAGTKRIVVGGAPIDLDPGLAHARTLADALRFGWRKRTQRGFFLRAEDFFNFVKKVNAEQVELGKLGREYEDEAKQSINPADMARAAGAVRGQQRAYEQRYGPDADARSHGESFTNLFQQRIRPQGLYLLDEPEAALSPLRQIGLLSMLKEAVASDSQFIIATHSPILLAFPGAQLLHFVDGHIAEADWQDLPHVTLTRDFLNGPERLLRHL